MFLHLSVSHSVHRAGACPSACWDTPPWVDTPWAGTPWAGTPLGRRPALGRHSLADGYCCKRYAPYWNALLYSNFVSLFNLRAERNKPEEERFHCLKSHKSSSLKLCNLSQEYLFEGRYKI